MQKKNARKVCWVALIASLMACETPDSQITDETFQARAAVPAYEFGEGPTVLVDAGHNNFHTAEGRYRPFAELLRSDGYVVRSLAAKVSAEALDQGKIFVVANALSERNVDVWSLPNYPAFTPGEVAVVEQWVSEGGSLLLIADHMPMPAATAGLASAFGVRFENGYAIRKGFESPRPPIVFDRENGQLVDHPITNGRLDRERIDSVATFTGQAFQAEGDFSPLLVFGPATEMLFPETPAVFTEATRRINIEGWYQGLALEHGKGRVAVFGEAAMFSAQTLGPDRRPMGMNSPVAKQNAQFALNLLHWLSGGLD